MRGFRFCRFGHIHRHVLVHLQHGIRFMEIRTTAARNQNRGNTESLVQFLHTVDKRRDRLRFSVHHTLHQLVADHKIRRRRVLVDQKYICARFHRLDHICRLRRASAGVLRGKPLRVFSVGKCADKHGNIGRFDAPAVLRPDFYRRIVRDHIFPAVSVDMVINACHQCL